MAKTRGNPGSPPALVEPGAPKKRAGPKSKSTATAPDIPVEEEVPAPPPVPPQAASGGVQAPPVPEDADGQDGGLSLFSLSLVADTLGSADGASSGLDVGTSALADVAASVVTDTLGSADGASSGLDTDAAGPRASGSTRWKRTSVPSTYVRENDTAQGEGVDAESVSPDLGRSPVRQKSPVREKSPKPPEQATPVAKVAASGGRPPSNSSSDAESEEEAGEPTVSAASASEEESADESCASTGGKRQNSPKKASGPNSPNKAIGERATQGRKCLKKMMEDKVAPTAEYSEEEEEEEEEEQTVDPKAADPKAADPKAAGPKGKQPARSDGGPKQAGRKEAARKRKAEAAEARKKKRAKNTEGEGSSAPHAGKTGGPRHTGSGKGGAKRHAKNLKSMKQGITRGDIKRLARAGGVKRISGDCFDVIRDKIEGYVDDIMFKALVHVEYQKKRTVSASDVVRAMQESGTTAYGIDPKHHK